MSPDQVAAIRESLSLIAARQEQFMLLFREQLLAIAPQMESTLPQVQAHVPCIRPLAVVEAFLSRLHEIDHLLTKLRTLGRVYSRYGIDSTHYTSIGAALMETLSQTHGYQYTPRIRDAWMAAYRLISSTMILGSTEAVKWPLPAMPTPPYLSGHTAEPF